MSLAAKASHHIIPYHSKACRSPSLGFKMPRSNSLAQSYPKPDGLAGWDHWREGGHFHDLVVPKPQTELRAIAWYSCSSAITSGWPCLVAHMSGVWPSLSSLLGLTSSRPSSIFATPSCPSKRAAFHQYCQPCQG